MNRKVELKEKMATVWMESGIWNVHPKKIWRSNLEIHHLQTWNTNIWNEHMKSFRALYVQRLCIFILCVVYRGCKNKNKVIKNTEQEKKCEEILISIFVVNFASPCSWCHHFAAGDVVQQPQDHVVSGGPSSEAVGTRLSFLPQIQNRRKDKRIGVSNSNSNRWLVNANHYSHTLNDTHWPPGGALIIKFTFLLLSQTSQNSSFILIS